MAQLILALNPGSTSTKLGLFEDDDRLFSETISHRAKELEEFTKVTDQMELRLNYIFDFLEKKKIDLASLDAVVGRGGLLEPIPGGTYQVSQKMIEDLQAGIQGEHASNLGGILARAIGQKADCPSYIVDPVVVDEMASIAKLSGLPDLERSSIFHALNQKAVARKYASDIDCNYQDLSLIVAHLGGGISVGIHQDGKVVDVNNALGGEGPFSPNRAGGLPSFDLFELCYSQEYSYQTIKQKLIGNGGVVAYLDTNNMREVEKEVKAGNDKAQLVFNAMAYQVAKEIGSLAPVVEGQVDAILLTGGIAYSDYFTAKVEEMVQFIAPLQIYPGEEELKALAAGAYRVLNDQEEVKTY